MPPKSIWKWLPLSSRWFLKPVRENRHSLCCLSWFGQLGPFNFGKITVYGIDNTDISECILKYQIYWFSSNSLLKFQFTVPSQNPTNHPKSLILTHYFWWTKMKTVNVCLIQRLQQFEIYSGITIKLWESYVSFFALLENPPLDRWTSKLMTVTLTVTVTVRGITLPFWKLIKIRKNAIF